MKKFTTKQKEAVSKKINDLAEQVMSKEMFTGFLTGDLIMRTLFLGTTAELSGNKKVNKFCQECLEKM